jgi:hypothetical protein
MTHRFDRDDHDDRWGTQTLVSDPIARPTASCAVEVDGRHRVFGADVEDGCGNAGPVEITKRFPPDLGNLAQNARFPHFHSRLRLEGETQKTKGSKSRK